MKFTPKALVVALSLPMLTSQVLAGPSNFGDARSIAMGGTGVASASPTGASFFNPALVASKHDDSKDDFGLVLPSINVRAADEEEVVNRLTDYQDSNTFETFQNAIKALNANPDNTAAALTVVAAAEQFNRDLVDLDQDAVRGEFGLGTAVIIPGQKLGISVFINGTAKGTASADYNDEALYEFYRDEALKIATGADDALDSLPELNEDDLQSEGTAIAAAKAEIGVTLAREFEIGDRRYAIGVSPKFQTFRAYDYVANVETFDEDDFDAGDYESEESAFNLDIGIATHFGDRNQWTVGFSGMNIIPVEINTADAAAVAGQGRGRIIEIDPLYRIGVAHSGEWHTIAVDLDLTENKAFGFEDDTQFLSIGGEIDALDFMQVRAGIRQNLADSNGREGVHEDTLFTAGLGFSPFGVHFDITGVFADGDVGAAAELGFTF